MGNGPGDSDNRNICNVYVGSYDKIVGASFKSNDRCDDACDEWVSNLDASIMTRFRSPNSNKNNISI
jgi:hypothetical protein